MFDDQSANDVGSLYNVSGLRCPWQNKCKARNGEVKISENFQQALFACVCFEGFLLPHFLPCISLPHARFFTKRHLRADACFTAVFCFGIDAAITFDRAVFFFVDQIVWPEDMGF